MTVFSFFQYINNLVSKLFKTIPFSIPFAQSDTTATAYPLIFKCTLSNQGDLSLILQSFTGAVLSLILRHTPNNWSHMTLTSVVFKFPLKLIKSNLILSVFVQLKLRIFLVLVRKFTRLRGKCIVITESDLRTEINFISYITVICYNNWLKP